MKNQLTIILIWILIILLLTPITVFALTLTITTQTDKNTYTVGDTVTTTVSWNSGMQAAEFTLEYDSNYLTFSKTSLANSYYYVEDGKINVSWAELYNETDCTEMTFEFIAIADGTTNISVTKVSSFADGNLVLPDGYDYTTYGTKTITIEKPTYITDTSIKINSLNNKLVLTGFNYSKKTFYTLNQLKTIFDETVTIKVYDYKNNEITDSNALIGTGSKINLYKANKLEGEYEVIIYGDTTGDGMISAIDALAIVKHLNKKITFSNSLFIPASKLISEETQGPTAVDALCIIQYLNNHYNISQSK